MCKGEGKDEGYRLGGNMSDKDFIKGILIIAKYIPKDSDYNLAAEHDKIYYGEYDWVKGEDRKKLKELGWFEDEDSWAYFV